MPAKNQIESMFNKIARRYDLLNNLLSLGTHWLWKKKLVDEIKLLNPYSIVDIASGTGDIISKFQNQNIKLLGTDISNGMLEEARKKFPSINFIVDDITQSSLDNKSYDVSCISYGIRNVSSIDKAILEMERLSIKGIFILEFGQPENRFLRTFYFAIMKYFIPFLGGIFSTKDSYKYLIESSMNFPSGVHFTQLCHDVLGERVKKIDFKPVFGGITYIYKIELNSSS